MLVRSRDDNSRIVELPYPDAWYDKPGMTGPLMENPSGLWSRRDRGSGDFALPEAAGLLSSGQRIGKLNSIQPGAEYPSWPDVPALIGRRALCPAAAFRGASCAGGRSLMRNTLVVALVLVLSVIASSPAAAQAPAPDAWRVTVLPYLMGAGMSGTAAVSGPGSESRRVGLRHLRQPAVRRHGPRHRAQGELGRRRRRHLDGPRRERDGTGTPRHHGERRYEPGRVCLLRTAPSRSRRRRLLRRPHQLSEHQSPHQPAAECPQRRRLEDLVRPHRRTPAAHAGERQTVACAGVHGDRRLRRRVHVHVAGVSDGRGEPRASGPQSSSATAGSISTTRPARTRRCSSTTCSRRAPCSASDSGSEADAPRGTRESSLYLCQLRGVSLQRQAARPVERVGSEPSHRRPAGCSRTPAWC